MTARTAVLLGVTFLRRGGAARGAMVAGCTAIVSGLLLVALTVVLFGLDAGRRDEVVADLVADGGVRGGYVLALLLICLAPLLLLRQVLRLGTAAREQRLAALRLAGATPREVRAVSAVEVALPALVGGAGGWVVLGVLRLVLAAAARGVAPGSDVARQLRLVPTSVSPSWWQVLLVALVVALLGAGAGATAGRGLTVSPTGVARRAPRRAPRPWGLVPVLGAPVLALSLPWWAPAAYESDGLVEVVLALGLLALVVGLLALAPWLAHVAGRVVAARTRSVPVLIAARRLVVDARPAGRAGAAVGVIALAAGVVGVMLVPLLAGRPDGVGGGVRGGGRGRGAVLGGDAYLVVPLVLIVLVLLVALGMVVLTLALHAVETTTDHARSLAGLGALGVSPRELERALRWEVGLVAVPVAAVGVVIGSRAYASGPAGPGPGWTWLVVLLVLVLVLLAVRATTLLTRPWVRRALDPTRLRTP